MRYVYDYVPGVTYATFHSQTTSLSEAGWEVISVTEDAEDRNSLTLFVRRAMPDKSEESKP